MDNFALEDDSNGNGGLSNGDLGLSSHSENMENHAPVGDVVSSPGSSMGVSIMASQGAPTFSMATGSINSRDIMSPASSIAGMTTKSFANSLTTPAISMMQQMPVSTLGMPTPATPHLSADQNMKRSSEQTPQNGGLMSSNANSMPVSFGYSVQSTMANALLQRGNQSTGVVGSNMHTGINMMNKMQMPVQNMNFQAQNPRFANANTIQMFGTGPIRVPNAPNQMIVNPAMLKMPSFQNEIRHMMNQQQHAGMAAMNGPVGVQNNVMKQFQMNNNPMMAQVCRFLSELIFLSSIFNFSLCILMKFVKPRFEALR